MHSYTYNLSRLTESSHDVATSLILTAGRHFEVLTLQFKGQSDNSTGLLKGKTLATESFVVCIYW